MLTKQRINSLLEVNTNNKENSKILRIMSCDNPVKDLYLYELKNIKREFDEKPQKIDDQISLCIFKFYMELKLYLEGKPSSLTLKNLNITLDSHLIDNAIEEIYKLYYLIDVVLNRKDFYDNTFNKLLSFQMDNYISILQLFGLINISNNIYNSKMLSILLTLKEIVKNYKHGKITKKVFTNELTLCFNYLSTQLDILKHNFLYKEDFLIYIIIFDIRKY